LIGLDRDFFKILILKFIFSIFWGTIGESQQLDYSCVMDALKLALTAGKWRMFLLQ
jgi:hypothetical protein